jgi:hypothetical protein
MHRRFNIHRVAFAAAIVANATQTIGACSAEIDADKKSSVKPKDTSAAIHYFRDKTPVSIILRDSIIDICNLMMDTSGKALAVDCKDGVCASSYTINVSPYLRKIILTPQFDILFPYEGDDHQQEEKTLYSEAIDIKLPDSLKLFTSTSSLHTSIRVTQKGISTDLAAGMTDCSAKISQILTKDTKLYEENTIFPENSGSSERERIHTEILEVDDIEHGFLELRYPDTLRRGSQFPLEARFVISETFGGDEKVVNPTTDLQGFISNAQNELISTVEKQKIIANNNTRYSRETNIGDSDKEFHLAMYSGAGLVQLPSSISFVNIKANGEEMGTTSLTPERQQVIPLQATLWSWLIDPKKSGEKLIYLTLTDTTSKNYGISRVLSIKVKIQEAYVEKVVSFALEHIEWIVGSMILPVLAFAIAKMRKNKAEQS